MKKVKLILIIFLLLLSFLIIGHQVKLKISEFSMSTKAVYGSTRVNITVGALNITVLYEEYKGATRGSSTNFSALNDQELQSVTDMILENIKYGKIKFNEIINISDDKHPTDYITDLDSYTNVSHNRIEVDSEELPNLNKSATLWLYNLTFNDPRILRNSELCPATICTEESYSGGTLKFNVTSFAIYSAEETPTPEVPAAPGIGGAGGAGIKIIRDFIVEPDSIKILLKVGESLKKSIEITNTGTEVLNIVLDPQKLKGRVYFSESKFSLKPEEKKTVDINFVAGAVPGVYVGEITVKARDVQKVIKVIMEVESRIILFDTSLEIPSRYKELYPGEDLLLQIMLFKLGGVSGLIDVDLDYIIVDTKGNIILTEYETISVETQVAYTKTIHLPPDIELGDYVAILQTRYDESFATSTDVFKVIPRPTIKEMLKRYYPFIIIILVIIAGIIISIWYQHRVLKNIREIQNKKLPAIAKEKPKIMQRKLRRQLSLLDKSFELGYISKNSYVVSKRKIMAMLEKARKTK